MTHLYEEREAHAFALRLRRARLVSAAVWAAALSLCVLLCLHVTTGNAMQRRNLAIALSALAGWAYLIWLRPWVRGLKAECLHFESVFSQTPAAYTGVIRPDPEAHSIPGSIKARRVRLDMGDKEESFFVNERFATRLPSDRRATLYCAGSFIRDFEAEDEDR